VSDVVVLKIGGAVLGEEAGALDVVGALHDSGHSLVVVHGGGPLATEWSGRLGLETRFVRGLRVTDAPTRDVALATLTGLTNTRLVAALVARGVPAVGLSGVDGGMLRAEREDAELGLVGRVTLVDSGLLEELLDAGRVPVVAPAALDKKDGEILNVNGDGAAGALAASLGARTYPGPAPEVGVLPVELTAEGAEDPVFRGLPARFLTLQWHGDTFDLPEGSVRLAGSGAYPNQAFRFGETAYGVQFHLEVSPELAREWADVPEYAEALERVLGAGAFDDFAGALSQH